MPHKRRPSGRSPRHDLVDLPAFELLHGAHLVVELLQVAGRSGTVGARKRDRLFVAHPELAAAYERAVDACCDLYQAAGAVALDDGSGK